VKAKNNKRNNNNNNLDNLTNDELVAVCCVLPGVDSHTIEANFSIPYFS